MSGAAERWQRLEAILDAAFDARPEDLRALVERLTAGDAELRREVESLLRARDASSGFLETSASTFASPFLGDLAGQLPPDEVIGTVIGRYRVVEEIGHGGGGRVYLAERADGQFDQKAALKVVRRGRDTATALARFVRERQILAQLDHPNIARLFDGGVTDDGRPYLVMELIAGRPITAYCTEHGLDIPSRLRLFVSVCRAVQYAHQRLIVHRDLKPSNVLVTAGGEVKLLDFGIATLLGGAGEGNAEDAAMMTPEYASPEQLNGESITTASDVYQLGVLLCELVTGVRPQQRDARHSLNSDLDAIVQKALRARPEERYRSADELAEDLERFQAHLPVLAIGKRRAYRLRRFIRRRRIEVAASIVVAALFIGAALFYAVQIRRERDQALRETDKAMESARLLSGFLQSWDPDSSDRDAVSAAQVLADSARRAEQELAGQPETLAATLSLLGDLNISLGERTAASALLSRALAIQERLFTTPDTDLAATLARQGRLQFRSGQGADSIPTLNRALEMYRKLLGVSHPETLAVELDLAISHEETQQLVESERLVRDVIAKAPRDQTRMIADATGRLGYLLFLQARYPEAVAVLRPALAQHRALLGDMHPTTGVTMGYLAAALREPSQLPEAEGLAREVLRGRRSFFGDRVETSYSALALAVLLERKGDFAGAEEFTRQSLAYWERQPSPHIQLALNLRTLGGLRLVRGDRAEAERHLRRSLMMFRGIFPNGAHPDEADVLNRLAFLVVSRRASDAATIYKQAVDFERRRTGGPYFITDGYEYLALAAQQQGDRTLAEQLYRRAVTLYEQQLPAGHPYRVTATRGLAELGR